MGSHASLSGVTSPRAGEEVQLARATARHTMIVSVTGTPLAVTVALQGSHDGFTWTDIGIVQSATGGLVNTTSDGALVSWIRADLRLLGGTASVTATIASDDGT